MPLRTSLVGALAVAAVGLAGCGGTPSAEKSPSPPAAQAASRLTADEVKVVAVGDVACPPGSRVTAGECRQADTAALAGQIDPDAVIALGDLQYQSGALTDFRNSYDKSWGALKPITFPVPGNHEYRTSGASGYYGYFADRPTGKRGYYSRMLGDWRAYMLNSNCSKINCAAQRRWLRRSLTNRPAACTLFAMHHPRFSSGEHGSQVAMKPFVKIGFNHRVDLVLSGHDHHYERFRRSSPGGANAPAKGFFQFVAGAGGKSHYEADPPIRGSLARNDSDFGVLDLTLRKGEFSFAFRTIDGATSDQGVRYCK